MPIMNEPTMKKVRPAGTDAANSLRPYRPTMSVSTNCMSVWEVMVMMIGQERLTTSPNSFQ
jgi:hypothetical protein